MSFTDEEKEIIKDIAKKDRYTLNDFFEDHFRERGEKKLSSNWDRYTLSNFWFFDGGQLGLRNVTMSEETKIFIFDEEYKASTDKFIKIMNILKNMNMIITLKVDIQNVQNNFRNFGSIYTTPFPTGETKEFFYIDDKLCKQYEEYCVIEFLVVQSDLQEFINNDFKTKDELRIEDEIKARNEALKDAKNSFWVSVFLALLSVAVSIIPLFKTDKVIIENQINTQQLELQLKQTNLELQEIKDKFETLKKQSEVPSKK